MASLQRDVGGLEAIVQNLDDRCRTLDRQCVALYNDAYNNLAFVSPNGPAEDELVSTCTY